MPVFPGAIELGPREKIPRMEVIDQSGAMIDDLTFCEQMKM